MLVSTERAVAMTTTSLYSPLGKSGRMGLSMRRAVKMPLSLARPSRFLKPPGILPTAYIFSSKSTCRGKKSIPSRGFSDMVTLTITTVSPQRTTHEPLVCSAYLPVSTMTFLPPTSVSNCLNVFVMILFYSLPCSCGDPCPLKLIKGPNERSALVFTYFLSSRREMMSLYFSMSLDLM